MGKYSDNIIPYSKLLKLALFHAEGQRLGAIKELILNKTSGFSVYLIVELADKQGIISHYAIPWQQIQLSNSTKEAIANISLSELDLETYRIECWPLTSILSSLSFNNKDVEEQIVTEVSNLDLALEAVVRQDSEQTEAEILQKTDSQGYNLNPSEQHVYPGVQIHQPDIATNK